jgi:hypothetical protein
MLNARRLLPDVNWLIGSYNFNPLITNKMFHCLFNRNIKSTRSNRSFSMFSLKKNREEMLILEKVAPHFKLEIRNVNFA